MLGLPHWWRQAVNEFSDGLDSQCVDELRAARTEHYAGGTSGPRNAPTTDGARSNRASERRNAFVTIT